MPLPKAVQMAAELGWSLIPVRSNKRPRIDSWKKFQEVPASLEQLQKWSGLRDVAGWAVITGKVSGLVILDFDGDSGKKVLKALGLKSHVTTGSGGAHVYFKHPGWAVPTLNSKTSGELKKHWPGLDIRADGGYAVFWGENASGRYRWQRKADLENLEILPLPLRQTLRLVKPQPTPAPQPAPAPPSQAPVDLPGRLLDMALSMAAAEGRNNAGFWYACQLRDNRVPEQLARGLMERYAAAVPSTNTKSKHEPYTAAEALTSLREAYRSAPRDPIPQKKARQQRSAEQPQPAGPLPTAAAPQEEQEPYLSAAGAYRLSEGGLRYVRTTKDGSRSVVNITNFPAVITADVVRDNGESTSRAFKIYAKVHGRPHEIIVSSNEFGGMNWPLDNLGSNAIVYPNLKEHAKVAMQELSRQKVEQYVYQHTGWTQIDGRHVYLHAGGGIGAEGPVTGLMVELDPQLKRFHLPAPAKGRELIRSIQSSLTMLNVVPDRVMIPLFSSIWRVVLGSVDVAIHLAGRSGNGKSELAALAQQHFGKEFTRKNLPAAWDSTANSLQGISFYAKNALLTVDDFVPRGSSSDIARLHRDADRLIRSQGNQQGRGRMNADGSLRATFWPRGMILSTGEDVPKGNSCRARMVIVETDPADMKWDRLTGCQRDAANGLYSQTMAAFLQWVAPKMTEIHQRIIEHLAKFRAAWKGEQHHRRTPDNLANLSCGLEVFLEFALEVGALSKAQVAELWERAMIAYAEAAEAQDKNQADADPTLQYCDLVVSALSSGNAHLVTPSGCLPDTPAAYGWQEEGNEWRPQGPKIGWIDGENVYLEKQASFAAAQKIGRDISDAIPITLQTLGKRLQQCGILASKDKKRGNYSRKTFQGAEQKVFHILRGVLYRELETAKTAK